MENVHQLSFGKAIKLQDNLAEIIIDTGVELNMVMVSEYHKWLLENLAAPFGMLVNKMNKYTYTFNAQMNLATLDEIKVMAVVTYDTISKQATNILIQMPRQADWHIQIFHDRNMALNWLTQQLAD